MSIPGSLTPLFSTGAAAGGYQVSRSLRFNSADSAYLGPKTFGSPTSSIAWTWASWVKKTLITTSTDYRGIFECGAGSNYAYLDFSDNGIRYANRPTTGTIAVLQTTPVYRDASAWFHVVFVYDSANGTSTDRLRLYVNGTRVTTFSSSTYPDPSQASVFNSAVDHRIGRDAGNNGYLDGYLADIHFIDGQALTPSSFTEVSATTGQLIPLAYSGTFGTNGFWLKFSDNSAATAAALGNDYSGNNNDWTPNNLSVTAGAGNDSLVDTPTSYGTDTGVGGEVRGNYATLNPLQHGNYLAQTATLSNGNLDAVVSFGYYQVRGNIAVSTGKFYWEITINSAAAGDALGIISSSNFNVGDDPGYYLDGYSYSVSGTKRNNASSTSYGSSYTTNDIIGVALDMTAGTIAFYKNGTSQGTAFTSISGSFYPAVGQSSASGFNRVVNFGQRAFAYQTPGTNRPAATFLALCDTNLPAPLTAKPNTLMDVVLYTGTGAALTPTSSLGFNPDWIWIKSRSAATDHALYDVVRGAQARLESNTTDAEVTTDGGVTAFNSAGFTLGTLAQVNTSSATYAAWCWDAGTSTVSNTAGSITSQVRANVSAGFSVVTWTGQTAAGTIGHGLGVAPSLIICKSRSNTQSWGVYHKDTGINNYLLLDSTGASTAYSGIWGSSAPTSTVFGVPGNVGLNNNNTWTYVAYCFAPVVGYSSFGSYTGTGADGPFVWTGMRPRWVLFKRTNSTSNWLIYDSARNTYNLTTQILYPNGSNAEATGVNSVIDILSNGFKIRDSGAGELNVSAGTYIFAAFAENPFQYARAR